MRTDHAGPRPIRRVMVVAKLGPPQGTQLALDLARWLEAQGIEVRLDADTAAALGRPAGSPRDRVPPDVDLAIVAGGDGTLLSLARSAAPQRIPILGINFGSLGFLTELQPDEIYSGLQAVLQGDYAIEKRQTLRVRFLHGEQPAREYALLNDAVIAKSALARMIVLGLLVDGEDVATYTSDGLILSTPTGSTAYNLSAGGPILDPRMSALVITPICPHTMTYRPLVVPASVGVEVTLRSPGEEVYLTLDGQIGFPFQAGDRLLADLHPQPLRLIRVAGRSFFQVLRRKLRWGER
jgi:NAD+ kinase